jgi:hypothetical protein
VGGQKPSVSAASVVGEVLPLARELDAFQGRRQRGTPGKIVLTVASPGLVSAIPTTGGMVSSCMGKADLYRLVDTLPDDVVQRIEEGSPVTLVVTRERGQLKLREVAPDQAWFWTQEWQRKEREAEDDLAAGRYKRFHSDEDFLEYLDRLG